MKKNQEFFKRFEEFAKRHKLFKPGEKILVGFSGGADSTALLLALWHLKSIFGFSLLAAHVNYRLRGKDSQLDEEFVRDFCFERNISLVVKNVNLPSGGNMENQAREIRFSFFDKLRKLYKVDKIALGHNRKDQAETMLFRLFRGSGYAGIKGISPISGNIIHPILCFTREEIEAYLQNEGIQWREDKTNYENIHSRNKIRNELLPWLQKNMNNTIVDKLYNTASIFSDTDDILEELARRRLLKAQLIHKKNEYHLSLTVIMKTRPVLRFYLFRNVYAILTEQKQDFYTSHFDEIEAILPAEGSKQVELPHQIVVRKEYQRLVFLVREDLTATDVNNVKEISALRNRITFEDTRIIMKKLKKQPLKRNPFEDREVAFIDLDKTSFPLTIRHRQPGDRFIPLGMNNCKRLKDFFIDEKIPKFDRDKVLIF
nr:tRNA lysidine(34) synthetase TilS [Candidatus Cloacimonadota bacterium]